MFKIIGAAAAAANLFLELSIPEKKEDRLTKNKKGNVILVRLTAKSNFKVSLIFLAGVFMCLAKATYSDWVKKPLICLIYLLYKFYCVLSFKVKFYHTRIKF